MASFASHSSIASRATQARALAGSETPIGLEVELHAPFFDILKEERARLGPVTKQDQDWLAKLTVDMVDRLIREEVSNVGFWKSGPRQEELRSHLFMFLDENEIVDFDDAERVAERLLDLARANHDKLVKP